MPKKGEVWIKGFEGLYTVDEQGEIRTYKEGKGSSPPGTKLVQSLNTKGYPQVRIYSKDRKGFTFRVHRIVANAFLLNTNNLTQVDHIDSNKLNNSVDNLRWVTNQINTEKELAKTYYLQHKDGTGFFIFNLSKWCRDRDFDVSTLMKLKNNQRKTAYGFNRIEVYHS